MKRILQKSLLAWLCLALLMPTLLVSAERAEIDWYCKHTSDHTRPPLGADLKCIEKHRAFYADTNAVNEPGKKTIYLTFDAGYENGNVAKILDILRAEEVPAAFFVLKHLIVANTDLIKRMTDEGHLVCNHTANHRNMARASKENFTAELRVMEDIYRERTGREISKYYRPPEGKFSEDNLQWADDMGYKTIFWSYAYADWDSQHQPDKESATQKIMAHIHPGAIILLHPTSDTNVNILPAVIAGCRAEGYTFASLDQLSK
ncbi:MAG: polysaccharide deacetylase family protein [Eubacteriales bacterium]